MSKSLFRYVGSKTKLAKKLIPLFPKHKCYIEVFGGSGAVLLAKPPSEVEVFNDLDLNIVNVFRQLRENYNAFTEMLELIPYSREEFFSFIKHFNNEEDNLKKAVMWLSINQQAF